ncbi:MAG: hypothetical protein ACR2H3_11545 [Acidimicrobiales bacterium]
MPAPWFVWLWLVWIAAAGLLVQVARTRPLWTPAVPVGALVLWVTVVQFGDWFLGWTAWRLRSAFVFGG